MNITAAQLLVRCTSLRITSILFLHNNENPYVRGIKIQEKFDCFKIYDYLFGWRCLIYALQSI